MNFNFSFEQYPIWYILLCLLLGTAYAVFLYLKDRTFADATPAQRRWIPALAVFRTVSVATIAFLLLAPLLKFRTTETIKPYILILNDNSESIQKGLKATNTDTAAYKQKLQTLTQNLQNNYEVKTYNFADKLADSNTPLNYTGKSTNIAQALDDLYNKYSNQNVGAVILSSDGIYNQGANPLYAAEGLTAPIYTIALGDTTPKRDLILNKVLYNKVAYLGNKFTLHADLSAINALNANSVLTVYKGKAGQGQKLYSKPFTANKNEFLLSDDIILQASEVGLQRYTLEIKPVANEMTELNNVQEVFVEVIDNRQKVLILAASPHPDIAALKRAIETNANYETQTAYIGDFNASPKNFDIAILHGLPNNNPNAATVIKQLKENNVPIWFIVSQQTDIAALNQHQNLIKINANPNATNEVKSEYVAGFNLFLFDPAAATNFQNLPPLLAPFGSFVPAPTAQVFFKQKIGNVATTYPLLVMEQPNQYKTAVLCAEGLWRWRMYDYKQDKNQDSFNELISKIVQYLTVKNDKRKFRVTMPKNVFTENEQITFEAEVYNDSYELINTPEVNITLTNEQGKDFPFTFNKTGNGYALNAGFLPVGTYKYNASTLYNNQKYTATGVFSVSAVQLEALNTTANHQLLNALSQKYGGELIYPDSTLSLMNKITQNPAIKPLLYSTLKTQSIINLWWLFGIILALLAIEWFVRKYIGGY